MSPNLISFGLTFHGVLATTKSAPKTNDSFLFILIGMAILVYIFVFRGKNQQRKRVVQQGKDVNIGDEVMLTSGIIGRITEIEGDRASIEIAPDIEIEVVRRAIAQRIDTPPDDDYDAPDAILAEPYGDDAGDDHDGDDHDGDDHTDDAYGSSDATGGSHDDPKDANSAEDDE